MHRSFDVEDTGQCVCSKVFKVKSEIMYFLVNAFPPKPLDAATSNFTDALVRSKANICDGVPSILLHGVISLPGATPYDNQGYAVEVSNIL